MGTTLSQDQVRVAEEITAEDDMYRSPEVTKTDKKVEIAEEFKSPTNSEGSPSKDQK